MATSVVKIDNKQFELRQTELRQRVQQIVVVSAASCLEAKMIQRQIREEMKMRKIILDPFVNQAKSAYDTAKDERAKWITPLEADDETLAGKVKTYEREEREAAQREQDRINAENARLFREKAEAERKERERLAKEMKDAKIKEIKAALKAGEIGKREAAKMLKEAGADAEAAIEQAAADAEAAKNAPPPKVEVKPNIPTVAGVPSRVNFKVEVTHPDRIINAYIDAVALRNTERVVYLRQFIMPNEQAIGAEARKVKNSKLMTTLIPGCRFYED